jgi:hypothetical protein
MYVPMSLARSISTRPRASGTTYSPVSGNTMSVQDSHSATVPVMTMDRAHAVRTTAPMRWWVRIHGSIESPSGRVQAAKLAIGTNGYFGFSVGRSGAMTWASPAWAARTRSAPSSPPPRGRVWSHHCQRRPP